METTAPEITSQNFPSDCDNNVYKVLHLIRRCIRATDRHSKSLQSRYGLTIPQQLCLLNLGEDNSLSVSELAKRIHLNPSTMVGIVDRLEKRGLLSRARQSKDRRVVHVQATEKGVALVKNAPPPIQEKLVDELNNLPKDEQDNLVGSLETIVNFMDIEEFDSSPLLVPSLKIQSSSDKQFYDDYSHAAISEVQEGSKNKSLSKTEGFSIRAAEWEDMEHIANFIRSTADWYRPFSNEADMAEHEVDEDWKELNFHRREFFIGYSNKEPIGTISIQHFGDYAYLGYIYLDEKQVGKGYGQILMSFIEQVARGRQLKGMVLISHPKATWAVRAYEKFGFKAFLTEKADILKWENGIFVPYYEEGFHLFRYEF